MRKKFESVPHRDVILPHGPAPAEGMMDKRDKLTFRVEALPAGYDSFLRLVLPEPQVFGPGGKLMPQDPRAVAVRNNRYCYLMIERGLRSDGSIDSKAPKSDTEKAWGKFADEIEAEFVDANFSAGDVAALLKTVTELSGATQVQDAAGN